MCTVASHHEVLRLRCVQATGLKAEKYVCSIAVFVSFPVWQG